MDRPGRAQAIAAGFLFLRPHIKKEIPVKIHLQNVPPWVGAGHGSRTNRGEYLFTIRRLFLTFSGKNSCLAMAAEKNNALKWPWLRFKRAA